MPEVGDRRDCTYAGCPGKMVLHDRRMASSSVPKEVAAGAPFPTTDRLHVWICEMNPRRHVEVATWGMRRVKGCSVKECKGGMVHSDKGRIHVPDDLVKRPGQPYARLKYEAGWVCMENESHFEAGERP